MPGDIDLQDLKARIGRIVVGYTRDQQPITASQLKAHGAMTALLRDAIKPNLVQTLENNPAFIHGGPFANIAHGCNSVIATKAALKMADWVVTEAGFGADLGAEKFIDIKCRKSGLRPDAVVIVATVRALKMHGGVDKKNLGAENLEALGKGLANLERHVNNVRNHYGLPCVVALNHFAADTDAELALLKRKLAHHEVPLVVARHWAEGGAGAEALAREVVRLVQTTPGDFRFVYEDSATLWDKVNTVAKTIYGAGEVTADTKVRAQLDRLQASGYGHYPICIAKTQYSFSTDPDLRGAPSGHVLNVREVRLAAGAEFVVLVCGDILTMPGLPVKPVVGEHRRRRGGADRRVVLARRRSASGVDGQLDPPFGFLRTLPCPPCAQAKPWAGARRRLAAAVGPCRADCAAVLALGSRRRTHYAHCVRCVQTSCDESVSRSALRAPTQALRSSPPQMRAATHPPTALRETPVLWAEERRAAGLEPASRRDARAGARAANRRLDACDSPSLPKKTGGAGKDALGRRAQRLCGDEQRRASGPRAQRAS